MSKHRIKLRRGDFSSQRIEKHKNYGQLLEQHQRSRKMGVSNYLIGLIVLGSVLGLSYYALDRLESIQSSLSNPEEHSEQIIKEVEPLSESIVKTSPSPQGGLEAYYEYVKREFKVPKAPLEGIVYVAFTVELDGSLSDLRVLKGLSPEADQIALDLVKDGPDWMPATVGGDPVVAPMVIPITFTITGLEEVVQDSVKL